MLAPNQTVSLWDMLELNAPSFLGAATQIARLRQIMVGIEESSERNELLLPAAINTVKQPLESLYGEADKIGAKLACLAANRLYIRIIDEPCRVSLGELSTALNDIESRFADHLSFVKLFVIPEERAVLFQGAEELLPQQVAALFPSVWFDFEEAAKCLCLGRSTASVFHAMRILEIAISSFALRLEIPDPVKATDRSWGNMLTAIRTGMDTKFPKKSRLPDTEGVKLEAILVSLDVIKNPWRNGTMHVESVYTDEEARHILSCTSHLMVKMADVFDEGGKDAPHLL